MIGASRSFKLLLSGLLMITICAANAQIYKWTDRSGNVHFSDVPHQGAEQLITPDAPNFLSLPLAQTESISKVESNSDPGNNSKIIYKQIMISQPQDKATIRNNQGTMFVEIKLKPELAHGDCVQLLFDGMSFGEPQTNLLVQMKGVERGTHTLSAQVVNGAGDVKITSDTFTVFMHRPRINQQGRPSGG